MTPGTYNHRFTAGDDYEVTITFDGVNTSAFTFKSEIRKGFLPGGALVDSFTVTPVTNGCVLSLSKEQTRDLYDKGRLVWDLQSDSGIVRTWLTGVINITPEVTND